jgi:hypothetical protein
VAVGASIPSAAPSSWGRSRPAVARPAARSIGGETAEHPGLMAEDRSTSPDRASASSSARRLIDGRASRRRRDLGVTFVRAPCERVLARALADRAVGPRPWRPIPGAAAPVARRRRS